MNDTTWAWMLQWTQVGPHVVVFKTHVDIFDKWDESIVAKLQELAKKHGGCWVSV